MGRRYGCEIETVVCGQKLVKEEGSILESDSVEECGRDGLAPVLDGGDAIGFGPELGLVWDDFGYDERGARLDFEIEKEGTGWTAAAFDQEGVALQPQAAVAGDAASGVEEAEEGLAVGMVCGVVV